MEIKTREIKDLHLATYNPRKITEKEMEKLKNSITTWGYVEPIIVNVRDNKNVVVGGNQRLKALKELGKTEVEVVEVDLDEDNEKALNIALNKISGEWEEEKLAELLKELEEKDLTDLTGFEDKEVSQLLDLLKESEEKIKIVDRFIVPPFSILDTRQGYWQDRKSEWISLGIDSEIGRDNSIVPNGTKRNPENDGCYKRGYHKLRAINTKEWVIDKLYEGSGQCENLSGVSIFDPVLCELMYKWFCVDNGKILDPFAGGSVRGIVANYLNYNYLGIDLSEEQIKANIKQGKDILPENQPKWIIGDSVKELDKLNEKVDFIFSCPPYFDLEIYTENPRDLSNMDWEEFKENYKQIIKKSVDLLKQDRFACFVVGEVRDKKGFYRDLISLTINNFEKAEMKYYNGIILIQSTGSLPIRITKQFSSLRKVGKMHQNISVFYKGDPKKIRDNFKEITKEIITPQ